jgi:hypothetical protein
MTHLRQVTHHDATITDPGDAIHTSDRILFVKVLPFASTLDARQLQRFKGGKGSGSFSSTKKMNLIPLSSS